AGMLRLVMGLGTSAVDRTEGSYPRLVSLDKPKASTAKNSIEKHRYSQKKLELINRAEGKLQQVELDTIKPFMPFYLQGLLLEHDYEAESIYREQGHPRDIQFISCYGIVTKDELMAQMKDILRTIQETYEYPVDTEFTINFAENGDYVINILQCRPLQIFEDSMDFEMPENIDKNKILFECEKSSMGLSRVEKMDLIVYVDAVKYYNMDYKDKYIIANAIGWINWKMRNQGKKMLLMVPGRIGTTSPELGVPTAFADISEFEAICEIANSEAGYNPELSYGSHFFQDLVESGILYNAIFENEKTKVFNMGLLKGYKNILVEMDSKFREIEEIVKVYDVSEKDIYLCNDMKNERIICYER
ncbi:MAG: phosphoenolpyruvate synthase, partial [Pseudobutyrivibrio sp.]|nr:phosphoenolpyruvate synthase [Pseudobutyrivibrio sp.]